MRLYNGIIASPGIVVGPVKLISDRKNISESELPVFNPEQELANLSRAIEKAANDLKQDARIAAEKVGNQAAAIFDAHAMFLTDPEFINGLTTAIRNGKPAFIAINEVSAKYAETLENLQNEYFAARAQDIRDVAGRLIAIITGQTGNAIILDQPTILISRNFTPSDTIKLDLTKVLGLATVEGSQTSHTAILARSLEIPALIGLPEKILTESNTDQIILDCFSGTVAFDPSKERLNWAAKKFAELHTEKEYLQKYASLPGISADGQRIITACNIGRPQDFQNALQFSPEGVGLYRTEFLFMERDAPPGEDEQYEAYRQVVELADPHEVIIRALDVGGDKQLSYLPMESEENPFLGVRGVRYLLEHPELFKLQLKAVLRAAVHGRLKLLIPMISSVAEVLAVKQLMAKCSEELRDANIRYGPVELGIMIEIPAAVVIADHLAQVSDFFSIGTNDLTQYTLAADRTNSKTNELADPFHPAVIRLIKQVVGAAKKHRIKIGVCGEFAGNVSAAPLLLGLGLDELSMSASSLPRIRERLARTTTKEAAALVEKVINCVSGTEVKQLLKDF